MKKNVKKLFAKKKPLPLEIGTRTLASVRRSLTLVFIVVGKGGTIRSPGRTIKTATDADDVNDASNAGNAWKSATSDPVSPPVKSMCMIPYDLYRV